MDTITVPDPRRWRILGVLCVALFAIVMDNTIVNVALPTLARELHADTSRLQWIVDAYTLVFAGLLLAAGGLGDRFGRKPALIAGLVAFGSFSVAGALASSYRPVDRRARVHGCRRGADLPHNAGDRGERLHRRLASVPPRSGSGPRSPVSASRSGRSPAAGSSSTSRGDRCSW